MGAGTRASTHNGRAGKNGAYSAKHNDRQFDTSSTDHIDPTLTPQNENVRFGPDFGARTNEEHELAFYQAHFGESLERKNAAYKAKGKAGQIKTMEQYYRSVKSCPEETLYTVGKDVEPQLLWKIFREHQAWKAEVFPQCQTLDASLHVDEPNAMPHVHERSVWIGHDAKGMEVVGQAKALAEMGVLPPDPEKKYGKFNNAKQTFTRECREHFIEICREYGLEVVEEPLPPDKVGLELTEYKVKHAQERLAEAVQGAAEATQQLTALQNQVQEQQRTIKAQKDEIKALTSELQPYRDLEASLAEVESTGKPIFPGYVGMKKQDLEKIQEQAKAYRANCEEVERVRERSAAVSKREQQADRREQQLDERAAELVREQQRVQQMYQRQLNINQLLEKSEGDRREKEQEITKLRVENRSLTKQLSYIKAEFEEKLRNVYSTLANIVKAVRLLKYNERNGFMVKGLTMKQGRLIDGVTDYGIDKAMADNFVGIALDMAGHAELSEELREIVEPQPERQREAYSYDDGPEL